MSSRKSRSGKHSWSKKYHRIARKNKLQIITETIHEEEEEQEEEDFAPAAKRGPKSERNRLVREYKARILCALARSEGDSSSAEVHAAIDQLLVNQSSSSSSHFDPKKVIAAHADRLEDSWLSMSKPVFKGCLGLNENNEPMYTLGRMAFDMFQPTKLVCSIQGIFNNIDIVDGTDEEAVKHVPSCLLADVRDGEVPVRSYNIVTAFTIEPKNPKFGADSPNQRVSEPIEGLMTTYGYILPYPKQNNRFSVWFTGGKLTFSRSSEHWHRVFNKTALPGRSLSEKGRLFVASLLMGAKTSDGMDASGKLTYELQRPIASYIDLLYMDEGFRIMRSSSGAVYVFSRPQVDADDWSAQSEGTASTEQSCSLSPMKKPMRRCSPPPSAKNEAPRRPTRRCSPRHTSPSKRPTPRVVSPSDISGPPLLVQECLD